MNKTSTAENRVNQIVHIPANGIKLEGALVIPREARGVVLFAHGSGSSRHSPRNNFVAEVLQSAGMGTLLMDLLTPREDATYETRFDIDFLTQRVRARHAVADGTAAEQIPRHRLFWGQYGGGCGAAGGGHLRSIHRRGRVTRWPPGFGDVGIG